MSVDDPLAALGAIPGELRDTRLVLGKLQEEVRKDRRMIGWLRAACAALGVAVIVAVAWLAYQQTVIDSESAATARNAHNLCVKLNRTRNEILPVWEKVLSARPDGRGLLARIEAAIPLGACPKG